jgi:hypothetical protein
MHLTRSQKLTLILLSITVMVVFTMLAARALTPVYGCLANQVRMSDGTCAPYVVHGLNR